MQHTDSSLDLCDVKRSRPDGACEVCRVGRPSLLLIPRCCKMKYFYIFINCMLFSAFVYLHVVYSNMHDVNDIKKVISHIY